VDIDPEPDTTENFDPVEESIPEEVIDMSKAPKYPAPVLVCPPGRVSTAPSWDALSERIMPPESGAVRNRINVRAKGQRGERQVVKLLSNVVDAVRTRYGLPSVDIQRNTLQSDKGGHDLLGVEGFSIEVKFHEKEFSSGWWLQCKSQATKYGGLPVLFYRRSQMRWRVMFQPDVIIPGTARGISIPVMTDVEDFIQWFAVAYGEIIRPK
jgi:hypothetical protein